MAHLVKTQTSKGEKNRWGTTWDCYADAKALFGAEFKLDACAEPQTAKAPFYYISPDWKLDKQALADSPSDCIGVDGLQCKWIDGWWCNPPFDLKRAFILKAIAQSKLGMSGMMLLPYEPCTAWFRDLVKRNAAIIYEPDGRYNFLHVDGVTKKTGVNFPSCFVVFNSQYNGGEARVIPFKRGVGDR